MSQVAIGITDLFDGFISSHASENANLPAENASTNLPSQVFEGGSFDVSTDNKWIDIKESGGSEFATALTVGTYTVTTLGVHIASALNANGNLLLTYTASQNTSTGIWGIGVDSGTTEILWKTGVHGLDNANDSMSNELGYNDVDTGLAADHDGDSARWTTHTFLVFDLTTAKQIDAVLGYLETNDDANASFSDLKVMSHSSDLGDTRFQWETTVISSLEWTANARGTAGFNRIQIAHPSTGSSTQRWWIVSWRHFDAVKYHRIGLAKAFNMVTPAATTTVAALPAHRPWDRSPHRSIENQYPAAYLGVWETVLEFRQWPIDDYETLLFPLAEHGKKVPILWALRWDDVKAGTHTAADETRTGFLLWACVADFGSLRFLGRSSEFASVTARIEQVR